MKGKEEINLELLDEEIKKREKIVEKSLKLMNEGLKFMYDYYKYMATLITGSLFVIVILRERVFKDPEKVWIVIISVALLTISLILLLGVLAIIRNYFGVAFSSYVGMMTSESEEKIIEFMKDQNNTLESMRKTERFLIPATNYTFISGILALATFVCINL